MGFWHGVKTFFGMGTVATDVLDKDNGLIAQAGAWIGNQSFTEEDKAELNKSIADGVIKYSVATLDENTTRSKARRDIAIKWVNMQINLIYFCVLCAVFELDKLLAKIQVFALSDIVTYGTGAVFLFFFGSYGLVRHNETKNKNQGK